MLSRGGAAGGEVGSSKPVCAENRAGSLARRVEAADQHCFIGLHFREVVVSLIGIVTGRASGIAARLPLAGANYATRREAVCWSFSSTTKLIFPLTRYIVIWSFSTTHSAFLIQNDLMPSTVCEASLFASLHA